MAVTIITSAGTHTPAYNHQNLVASSNQVAQPNHKFVVVVGINDSLYDDNTQYKLPARPDNSYLYFNPQRTAEAHIKSTFDTSALDFFYPSVNLSSEYKKITVAVGEEYGSPVSGFPSVSASYYAWNAAYNNIEYAGYVYATTTKAKDLTLIPSLTDLIKFEQRYLYKTWHRGFSTRNIKFLNILAYDATNALTQTTVLLNQWFNAAALSQRNYITLNCAPYGLNNISGGAIVSKTNGAIDIIPSNTAYYTMYFDDGAGPPQVSSNTYTINIDSFCGKYNRYVLHFLNRLGNYDSFTFNKLSRNNTEKETDMYKKIPYYLDSSNRYRYEAYTNDVVIYNTVLTNKMTLNSDFINDAKSTWLRDLFASPDIKLELSTGVGDSAVTSLISVRCTLKSYETKTKVNEKLFNLTIEVDNALQDIRQRC